MLLATICLFNMLKLLQLYYFKRRKKIGRRSLKKVESEGMRLTNAGIHWRWNAGKFCYQTYIQIAIYLLEKQKQQERK